MTIPQSAGDWRPGHPGHGGVVEVWELVCPILGYWDGRAWRAADDNRVLPWVSRWRPRRF